jgi:thiamine biosynthesis lipoprotein
LNSYAASLGLLVLLGGCALFPEPEPVTVSDGRYVMGTVLEITLVGRDEGEARAALAELFALAERLDALLTVYDPDDVTVGPLVELWTEAAQRGTPPSARELVGARERVGWKLIGLHADGSAELAKPGVSVNLGGLAKGYALDRMLTLLEKRGIDNALLSFGQSSTWAFGRPADAAGWRLLARGPDEGLLGVLTLENQALSVSGSLGQWVEIGGRRYGHVLDPRTGEALQQRRQALVVAPNAGLAEALSKALLVLGKQEGLALVDAQEGCEALLVDADAGSWLTSGWNAAVRFAPPY